MGGQQQTAYQSSAPHVWRVPESLTERVEETSGKGAEWASWVRETVQGLRAVVGDEGKGEHDLLRTQRSSRQERRRKSRELQRLLSSTPGAFSPPLNTATWGPEGNKRQDDSTNDAYHPAEPLADTVARFPESLAARLRRTVGCDLGPLSTLAVALVAAHLLQATAAEPVNTTRLTTISPPPPPPSNCSNLDTSISIPSTSPLPPFLSNFFIPSPSSTPSPTLAAHLLLPTLVFTLLHTTLASSLFYLSLLSHPFQTSLFPVVVAYCPFLLPLLNLTPVFPLLVFLLPFITYPVSIALRFATAFVVAILQLLEEDVLRRPGLLTRRLPTLIVRLCTLILVFLLNLVVPRSLGGSGLGARILGYAFSIVVVDLGYGVLWSYVVSPWAWAEYCDLFLRLPLVQHTTLKIRMGIRSWRVWSAVVVGLLVWNGVVEGRREGWRVWKWAMWGGGGSGSEDGMGMGVRRVLAVQGGKVFGYDFQLSTRLHVHSMHHNHPPSSMPYMPNSPDAPHHHSTQTVDPTSPLQRTSRPEHTVH
ncbi:uncharacterized protein EI97DRAFT_441486 [Westerdykella ornata]|uniref:Uncharacterized protein n=1 Tax=Westerdykella ornata TaxID=318751 RepID=A0A6A6JMH5_WESOR|nr:uncharacterized protein EI97DRAFT_441486 [Westerdykella ornata]KAF2277434.1 hypothetical protein EI97DRAFT_441486 [Westerdykella ornata]